MENTCCLLYMLILPLVVSTEETPTEKVKTDFTIKVTQEVEKGVLFETKNISALLGKEVTLVVNIIKESDIQDIQWVKNGINFATTKPKKEVTIRESSYNGKLRGSSDGSLVIQSLTIEDQGEYKADILLEDMKNYLIIYNLHISEERASDGTHLVLSVIVVLLLLAIGAGVAFLIWKKKGCFKSKKKGPATKERSDPEGISEDENKLQLKVLNQSPEESCDKTNDNEDETEEFHDAPEYPQP